ncbi:cytochrome-c peroxidase [Singulisphaera acidiphila]|uniref:Cytochrome c peroxidase n=1 Tax=Singulisphaera acidiphila (strain ATCC BAA-1392 / DSM 18658 / VKM B-2454 / MOB10) TaxID=886293 RepID=L0D4X3_SINAD|nr:cytochrome-c peroxidase [Singulisphaera acidiphila]AGA24479.1 cytochrome c peroxidase [Singulisphaera acidiphila DSM 18658]
MSATLCRLCLPIVLAGLTIAGTLGADGIRREPAPSAVHLVGHEDAALLKRVQDVIDDWDPRKLRNPYVDSIPIVDANQKRAVKKSPRRADLNEFIADVDAAEALGKAFFWEMQAGSDFRRQEGGAFVGTACASCHYRHGADARNGYTTRLPYVAWDKYRLDPDHGLEYGEHQQPFVVEKKATETIANVNSLYSPSKPHLPSVRRPRPGADVEEEEAGDQDGPQTPLSLIVGSQGVEPLVFKSLIRGNKPSEGNGAWLSEVATNRLVDGFTKVKPEWSMFVANQNDGGKRFRQITTRNSPTIINSGFADRLFHDGRAESTFNGISIFGDFDEREVLHVRRTDGSVVPVRVAISHAALASQAVGPIVNEVEMSYLGRSFHHLAGKLLEAPVLGYQTVAADDSHLGPFIEAKLVGMGSTYRALIQKAFRREWWDGRDANGAEQFVDLGLASVLQGTPLPQGTLMEANFSLYWGLSIMLYEASLVSNDSPFDQMMRGNGRGVESLWQAKKETLEPIYLDRLRTTHPAPTGTAQPRLQSGAEVFQRGFRLFMNRNCVECHSGPLFSELYSRDAATEPAPPIAYTLERILLPNSQADAIAIELRPGRDRAVEQTVAALIGANSKKDSIASIARRCALELELLCDEARGDQSRMTFLVRDRLEQAGLSAEPAGEIAKLWIALEKRAVTQVGGRLFFSEAERIATAALLADPVLVEKMAIPSTQVTQRRPLPIQGPLASESYAFYDLSFYALGVSPPRYDRGIGDWSSTAPEDDPGAIAKERVKQVQKAKSGVLKGIRQKYDLTKSEVKERVLSLIEAGKVGELKELNAAEQAALSLEGDERNASAADAGKPDLQSTTGAPGSAYRFNPAWKRRSRKPRPSRPAAVREAVVVPPAALAPGEVVKGPAHDLDKKARMGNPRDLSWFRDLPTWDEDFPVAKPPYDSVDTRRADVHFLSRTRALVQNERPWGHRKPLLHDNELAFWGAFKTPTLRNIELTAPYMHNGRLLTLYDVVDFYDRGGDLLGDQAVNPDKHPAIVDLNMSEEDKFALVFFLMCLTDERVRREQGPFDHPSLRVVNGYDEHLNERIIDLGAIGSCGLAAGVVRPTFPADR